MRTPKCKVLNFAFELQPHLSFESCYCASVAFPSTSLISTNHTTGTPSIVGLKLFVFGQFHPPGRSHSPTQPLKQPKGEGHKKSVEESSREENGMEAEPPFHMVAQ